MVIVRTYLNPDSVHLTAKKVEEWINKICKEENARLIAVSRQYFIFDKTEIPKHTDFEKALVREYNKQNPDNQIEIDKE